MTSSYFAPLVLLPTIITKPGYYKTRGGDVVKITKVSGKHDLGCIGFYVKTTTFDSWHKSGRIFATSETVNDIVE